MAPDGWTVGDKLLSLDLSKVFHGIDVRLRVSVLPCKRCTSPHHTHDMSKHLPAGLTQYVLDSYSMKSPS